MRRRILFFSCLMLGSSCAYGGGTSGTGLDMGERVTAAGVLAPSSAVEVSGTLLSSGSGKPLSGAEVTLETVRSSESVKTDRVGKFSQTLRVAARDKLSICVSAPKVDSCSNVQLKGNETRVRLQLRIDKSGNLKIVTQ